MPVGRRELERWSEAQRASAACSSSAMTSLVRAAHASGGLNLTGRGLAAVPPELLAWHAPIGDENWWDVVELRKLDVSHNAFVDLPDELFVQLSELQTLHAGNNQLDALPPTLELCSATLQRVNLQRNLLRELPSPVGKCLQLVFLNIEHNALTSLPDFIGDLPLLEMLSASHNKLRALPESIGRCNALTSLIVASNEMLCLPDTIGALTGLTELEAGHNKLEQLPRSVAKLASLVRLDARENKLTQPPSLPHSARLAEVLLGFNRLVVLPADVQHAPALSVLDVRNNCITNLDMDVLLPARGLKTLDLRNNEVTRLPPLLGTMTSLTALLLDGNPLKTMRRALIVAPAREILGYLRGRMSGEDAAKLAQSHGSVAGGSEGRGSCWGADELEERMRGAMSLDARLDLACMQLQAIPQEAARLTQLRAANLYGNALVQLPEWIEGAWGGLRELNLSQNQFGLGRLEAVAGLGALTSLALQRNQLSCVPEAIAALSALEVLDLSQNRIMSLNSLRVACMRNAWPRLHTLTLSHNKLEALPDELALGPGLRQSLAHLDVACNRLTSLPAGALLAGMTALRALNVENNELTVLEPALGLLHLRALMVSGNPLKLVPRAVQEGGTERILALLRDRMGSPAVPAALGPSVGANAAQGLTAASTDQALRVSAHCAAAPMPDKENNVAVARCGPRLEGLAAVGKAAGMDGRGVGEDKRLRGGSAGGGMEVEELQEKVRQCVDRIAVLEEQMTGTGTVSQAQAFALKKKMAMERAAKIRLERSLAKASV